MTSTAQPLGGYIGSTAGSFAVNADGGASYSVPIAVPPGIARLEPHLSLAYGTGGADGMVGVGWSLHGMSAITRCGRTLAQDGEIGTVSYGPDDRFSLDGQRLMLVAGDNYQARDAVYHTEVESWQRVVPIYGSDGAQSSGPQSFRVHTADGKILDYGSTADSRVVASATNPSVRMWTLARITDSNGNSLTITYHLDVDDGAAFPLRIDYTANEAQGQRPQRSVRFSYRQRDDVVTRYLGGFPLRTGQLLQAIESYLGDTRVRSYALAYDRSPATGQSRLLSITEADGDGMALPPTMFAWQDPATGLFQSLSPPKASGMVLQGTLLSIDVDGDGRADLVQAASRGGYLQLTLLLSDGTGFKPPIVLPATEIPYGPGSRLLALDIDGNGCIDLVCIGQNGANAGLTALRSEPDGTGNWRMTPGPLYGAGPKDLPWGGAWSAMDIDADGFVDLLYAYASGATMRLVPLFSDGAGRFAASPTDQTTCSLSFVPEARFLPMDFTGSGRTDLVYAYANGTSYRFSLFLSAGRDGLQQQAASPLPSGTDLLAVGTLLATDLNGDGLGDIVHAYLDNRSGSDTTIVLRALYSNGVTLEPRPEQKFSLQGQQTGSLQFIPGDYNGDGLPDLALAIQQGTSLSLDVLIGDGNTFKLWNAVTQPDGSIPSTAQILPMDVGGVGATGLTFAFAAGGGMSSTSMAPAAPHADLLIGITEGLGGRYAITYKPLTDPTVYTKSGSETAGRLDPRGLAANAIAGGSALLAAGQATAIGSGPVQASRLLDFPKYVVSEHRRDAVRGSAAADIYRYVYAEARMDLRGRGWLGFKSMTVIDPQVGTTATTIFNQNFPQTFSTASSQTRRSRDNALMLEAIWDYSTTAGAPNTATGVHVVLNTATTRKYYTYAADDAEPDAIELRSMSYDAFGNLTSMATTGSAVGAPLYLTKRYDIDVDSWKLRLHSETRRSADPEGQVLLDWRQYAYDDDGNMTTERYWNDQAAEMESLTYTVDGFGNRLSVTNAAAATTSIGYDDAFHTFPVRQISAKTGSGENLVVAQTYDARFGTVAREIDINGVVTTRRVDGLGRDAGTDGPDPSGKSVSLTSVTWAEDAVGPYTETTSRTDWNGATTWTRHYLDGFGQTFRTVSLGAEGTTQVLVDQTLDAQGRLVRRSLPHFAGARPVAEEFDYDPYGRLVEERKPRAGRMVRTTYDWTAFNAMVQTSAAGEPNQRVERSTFRIFADKVQKISHAVADAAPSTFNYDALGRLTAAIDPSGIATCATHDSLGRKTSLFLRRKDGGVEQLRQFTYRDKPNALAVEEIDPAGIKTVSDYDQLGRLITRTVTPPSGVASATTLAYDGAESSFGRGRVTRVDGPNATYRYAYDSSGNQTDIAISTEGETHHFKRSFQPGRRLGSVVFPDGSKQISHYGQSGLLSSVTFQAAGGAAPRAIATYDRFTAFGHPGRAAFGNGVTATFDYDETGRLIHKAVGGAQGEIADWRFQLTDFDTIGRIESASVSHSFRYDDAGRLVEASLPSGLQAFTYDAAGNLTAKDGIDYQSELYKVISGTRAGSPCFTAQYDANGNMVRRTRDGVAVQYDYDAEDRLLQAGPVMMTYDHSGRRIRKTITGGLSISYPAPNYETVRGPDGGKQHSIYIDGGYGLAAVWTTIDAGHGCSGPGIPAAGLLFVDRDEIESLRLQSNDQGEVTARIDYTAFGEPRISGAGALARTFAGGTWDADLGLYYLGARYYDPALGRFITADTQPGARFERPDALNRYAYCLNDPINNLDPTGHGLFDDIGHFIVGAARYVAHQTKSVFTRATNAFKLVFQNNIIKLITMSVISGVLVLGGAALFFTGIPPLNVLGATLVGAGLSGITYLTTARGDATYAQFGIHLGIGAAVGALTGGIGLAGTVFTGAAAEFASGLVARATIQGVARLAGFAAVAVRFGGTIVSSALSNAAGATLSQFLGNLDANKPLSYGLGSAALLGGAFGAGAGAVAGTLLAGAAAIRSSVNLIKLSSFGMGPADGVAALGQGWSEAQAALATTRGIAGIFSLPGIIFRAGDIAADDEWHPAW